MLTQCLQCGYSLRGLPEDHRCPECGLAYDRDSAVFAGRHRKLITVEIIAMVYLFLEGVGMLGRISAAIPVGGRIVFFLVILLIFAVLIFLGYHTWCLLRYKRFLAVMPEALLMRLSGSAIVRVPWENISRVAVQRGNPRVAGAAIFLKKEKEVRDLMGPFKNRKEAEQFVELAQRRIEAALNEPAEER